MQESNKPCNTIFGQSFGAPRFYDPATRLYYENSNKGREERDQDITRKIGEWMITENGVLARTFFDKFWNTYIYTMMETGQCIETLEKDIKIAYKLWVHKHDGCIDMNEGN